MKIKISKHVKEISYFLIILIVIMIGASLAIKDNAPAVDTPADSLADSMATLPVYDAVTVTIYHNDKIISRTISGYKYDPETEQMTLKAYGANLIVVVEPLDPKADFEGSVDDVTQPQKEENNEGNPAE